jgi:hypothetical protein
MRVCYACGQEVPFPAKISRQEICPHCRADLHCCLNCQFYDQYAENKCHEPSADWVSDREKNNFCDFFGFRDSRAANEGIGKQKEARAKLESLFKKSK